MKLISVANSYWGYPAPPAEELRTRQVNPARIETVTADRDGTLIIEMASGRTLRSTTMQASEALAILTAL